MAEIQVTVQVVVVGAPSAGDSAHARTITNTSGNPGFHGHEAAYLLEQAGNDVLRQMISQYGNLASSSPTLAVSP